MMNTTDKKHVLVIDDDVEVHDIVKLQLGKRGVDCTCVFTVEEAMQRLPLYDYDLVLLDLCFSMGCNDGESFLSYLRSSLEKGHIPPPVIVLSGLNDQAIIDYVLSIGAADYLSKPYKEEALIDMVKCHT